jgi:hypothetical protein
MDNITDYSDDPEVFEVEDIRNSIPFHPDLPMNLTDHL